MAGGAEQRTRWCHRHWEFFPVMPPVDITDLQPQDEFPSQPPRFRKLRGRPQTKRLTDRDESQTLHGGALTGCAGPYPALAQI